MGELCCNKIKSASFVILYCIILRCHFNYESEKMIAKTGLKSQPHCSGESMAQKYISQELPLDKSELYK